MLGFDTARSVDHEWGPRLNLFLGAEEAADHGADIHLLMADRLPKQIRGWPTHFRPSDDPRDPVGHMELTDGPVNHRVSVDDVGGWLTAQLGSDPVAGDLTSQQWLAIPQQKLAEVTGGVVFHDELGTLTSARRRLEWYPDQVAVPAGAAR